MHPLKELKKIIEKPVPNSGKVVRSGSELLVVTSRGQMLLTPSPGDATNYKAGDEIVLINGVIVGRRRRNPTVYIL